LKKKSNREGAQDELASALSDTALNFSQLQGEFVAQNIAPSR
jgi:hypothetical protein